jgi:signal transduction histidine kinase
MSEILLEAHGAGLDAGARHYLGRIRANVLHMEDLIRDLLALSQIGREARVPETVALDELVDAFLDDHGEAIRARGIKVIRHELHTVRAVRAQMERLVANLLGNALKYLGEVPSPTVEIGTIDRGQLIECFVTDNGIGIDPAHHRAIFEPFHRLKDIQADGTGIGLAIVRKIVEGAGGRAWVESTRGHGATFRFTWPKASGPGTDATS